MIFPSHITRKALLKALLALALLVAPPTRILEAQNANGNSNGNSNGNANGNSNGNANGNSNGNANGNSNGNANSNRAPSAPQLAQTIAAEAGGSSEQYAEYAEKLARTLAHLSPAERARVFGN